MSLTRKRRSTGKVTLADVAQLAGVGTMTVSRALRTPEQVSDKLREKIEAAVQELGYMPNLAASALASASSWTIAMVVPNLSKLAVRDVRRATAGAPASRISDHAGGISASS